MDRYKVNELSDENETTLIIGVPPTWRDLWKIIRGRYVPEVQLVKRATYKGLNRAMKEAWTDPKIREYFDTPSPLLDGLFPEEDATFVLKQRKTP